MSKIQIDFDLFGEYVSRAAAAYDDPQKIRQQFGKSSTVHVGLMQEFDDGTDLMYYQLRKTDGSQDPQSAGTWTASDGSSAYFGSDAIRLDVVDTWTSPQGGTYPAQWRLVIPDRGLDVEVVPVLADQELFTTVRYWEGAVDVSGTQHGKPLRGRGYVELTGYAD